ncbi:PTS fructose IIA subunit, partial [Escherichia coli]
TVCVVGKIRDLILQLSKSSIYSTKPFAGYQHHFIFK